MFYRCHLSGVPWRCRSITQMARGGWSRLGPPLSPTLDATNFVTFLTKAVGNKKNRNITAAPVAIVASSSSRRIGEHFAGQWEPREEITSGTCQQSVELFHLFQLSRWQTVSGRRFNWWICTRCFHPWNNNTGIEKINIISWYYWHFPHSMRSRVYETVESPSVRSCHWSTAAAACSRFAAERRTGRRYQSTAAGAGAQQELRSTALSSKCGHSNVDSWGTMLNTDC